MKLRIKELFSQCPFVCLFVSGKASYNFFFLILPTFKSTRFVACYKAGVFCGAVHDFFSGVMLSAIVDVNTTRELGRVKN